MLFHCSNGCTNLPQRYVIRKFPVLFECFCPNCIFACVITFIITEIQNMLSLFLASCLVTVTILRTE